MNALLCFVTISKINFPLTDFIAFEAHPPKCFSHVYFYPTPTHHATTHLIFILSRYIIQQSVKLNAGITKHIHSVCVCRTVALSYIEQLAVNF